MKNLTPAERETIEEFKFLLKREKMCLKLLDKARRGIAEILALADSCGDCAFSQEIYKIMGGGK